ncbi:MAG TPA: GNAT family N-acetyltransferase [Terrimesophilobacter sp.]|jgi:GNAT superfamily N-acetyltransferase|nr:GNAT family N-acetyltransferase [Terrimesophilobacter sp.]
MTNEPLAIRTAGAGDIESVVATVTSAFLEDPLWGPVFPNASTRAAKASQLWRLYVSSAISRSPWTLITEGAEAAAVWNPPGTDELTAGEEATFDAFLVGIVGRRGSDEIQEILRRFEAVRPREPHFYLSLLATHSDHRGHGLGMRVLRQSLQRIDALKVPAYLESSNPANDTRYTGVGFEPRERLTMPSGQRVTTMWRPAG